MSSLAAFAQRPGNVTYSSTKAWINSFTEGLYLELREIGSPVRVQALCPGFTLTNFHKTMGVDRSIAPPKWWMPADDVVNASMDGLKKGTVFVIPGWRYRLLAAMLAVVPLRLWHALTRRKHSRTD